MKKIILLAFLVTAPLFATAQDKASLAKDAQRMLDYTFAENYKGLMDLTYPKIFDLIPKEQMLEMLPKMLKGEGYTIKLDKVPENFTFGDIKKIEGGSYAVVSYDTQMRMIFTERPADKEIETMTTMFKENMKASVATFDKTDNSFLIKKRSQMIAAADAATGQKWTFLNNENPQLIEKLFSENIRKGLGL
ncbi:hypothetical protein R1T16_15325 [Flavobacterium sp. DG1-102-2]|uniref:hypothetical protein n=1 Tax=Flavobacterium sp. DG1-102-2 TaxID=3081663 RepID=UPI002949B6CE|nr:hypothetical protein [Flavobacterium sp. DG1-102-2]MDV6169807.1 hypothetical protein [Flavobacterium sp. DG1-102-2]